MTKKAQRQAIAETCGWTFKPDEFGWHFAKLDKRGSWWKYADGEDPFPDYLNDLNTRNEMWKTCTVAELTRWAQELVKRCHRAGWLVDGKDLVGTIMHAPQSFYCDSFLRAKGRWVA